MSESQPPLPQIGSYNWGDDLNTYLEWVSSYAASNDARVSALEAKPEYIWNAAPWTFNNGPFPAGNQQVRLDNPDPQAATLANFRVLDGDGADRSSWFQLLGPGAVIRLHDWDNAANYYRFDVTGPATFINQPITDAHVPIAWHSGAGTIPNGKANVGFLAVLGV